MAHYTCIVKSHCDSPDFEAECEAKNKDQAVAKFMTTLNKNNYNDFWDFNTVSQMVNEE